MQPELAPPFHRVAVGLDEIRRGRLERENRVEGHRRARCQREGHGQQEQKKQKSAHEEDRRADGRALSACAGIARVRSPPRQGFGQGSHADDLETRNRPRGRF